MAITDHFQRAPESGFVRSYDLQTARRQFWFSLGLILILAVAAFAVGMLVQFDAPTDAVHPAPIIHNDLNFAGSLANFRG
ncbi:MAG TPA: hypothetical protein VKV77_08220 [Methylovirgula sp.]|nr:hypothetical protein [Methylovirgula sp.]